MNLSKTLSFVMLSTVTVHTMAADFSFDRPVQVLVPVLHR